jgi:hypothetical protein
MPVSRTVTGHQMAAAGTPLNHRRSASIGNPSGHPVLDQLVEMKLTAAASAAHLRLIRTGGIDQDSRSAPGPRVVV